MANTIKIKRGLSSNIDNTTLAQGELAITTDTNELYVGKASGKEKINVQANYSQNDEKAADYIKNRLFHTSAETLFSGEATVTKEANSYEEIITIPFSDSFKKSDLECVWMITISFNGGDQYRLHRWNWNYEHGSSSDYEYRFLDLFMRDNGFTIKSDDNGLEVISINYNMSSDEYAQAISTTTSVILASNVKTEQLCLAPIEGITHLTTDPS